MLLLHDRSGGADPDHNADGIGEPGRDGAEADLPQGPVPGRSPGQGRDARPEERQRGQADQQAGHERRHPGAEEVWDQRDERPGREGDERTGYRDGSRDSGPTSRVRPVEAAVASRSLRLPRSRRRNEPMTDDIEKPGWTPYLDPDGSCLMCFMRLLEVLRERD